MQKLEDILPQSIKCIYENKEVLVDIYSFAGKDRENILERISCNFLNLYCHPTVILAAPEIYGSDWKTKVLKPRIPTIPHVIAGDFGEIFCYHFLSEIILKSNLKIRSIEKLRFKHDKDTPMPKTDILFWKNLDSLKICPQSFIQSVEAKVHSSIDSPHDQIFESIVGASKDYLGRISETLLWFDDLCTKRIDEIFNNPNCQKELSEYQSKQKEIEQYAQHYKAPGVLNYKKYIYGITLIDSKVITTLGNLNRDLLSTIFNQACYYQRNYQSSKIGDKKLKKANDHEKVINFLKEVNSDLKLKVIIISVENLQDFSNSLYSNLI